MGEKRWHRFRHYPNVWSTFDLVEQCEKPGKFCCGCEFKHPFCTESGKVLEGSALPNDDQCHSLRLMYIVEHEQSCKP